MSKQDPYATQTIKATEPSASQEAKPQPRTLNRRAVVLILVVVAGGLIFTVMAQSLSKQKQQLDAQPKESVVNPDPKGAKEEVEGLSSQAERIKEKERKAKEEANKPKPPSPAQDLENEQAQLKAQFETGLPQASAQGDAMGDQKDPWAQARKQHQTQSAQIYYQQLSAARNAPLFFGTGAPQLNKGAASSSGQSTQEPAQDEAQFLAQVRQAQAAKSPQSAPLGVPGAAGGMGQMAAAPSHTAQQEAFFVRGPQEGRPQGRALSGENVVEAGTLVDLVLQTGLNSDLPGVVLAQVTKPVYDRTMRTIMIPAGTKVMGVYNAQVAPGQQRAQVVWQRMIFADGRQVALAQFPGVDLSGQSGFDADVDEHWDKIAAGAVLSGAFSASGAALAGPTNQLQVRPGQQALYGAAQPFQTVGEGLAKRYLEVKPTLRLPPGARVGMLVLEDLRV